MIWPEPGEWHPRMPERLDDWRAARRGFGPEDLCRINPRLIYVDVNAYGFQGPWAERRGWEQLAQAVLSALAPAGGYQS